MRRILCTITVLAAAMVLSALPVLAEESTMGQWEQKDQCLLVAMNCPDNVDSLQQRIDKLQHEIAKGTDVYSRDELRILNNKLDEAYEQMSTILYEN